MAGMTFAKMKDEMPAVKSLRYLLHTHLNGPESGRSLSRIHASALTKEEGFCPRFYALSDVTKSKPKDEWLTTSENVTFRMGRDQQDALVHDFADMGKATGHWRCLCCSRLHEFTARPLKCELCGCKAFKPEEVRFVSDATGASCGIDMLVNLGFPKLIAVELKTMGKDQFKTLLAPLAEHRVRTNLYLRIIKESVQPWANFVDTNRAIILYVEKGGFGVQDDQLKKWGLKEGFSPFKEYDVKRVDADTDDYALRARTVKHFREGAVGMPSGICSSALAKRAVYCQMKAQCFSGQFPPEHGWNAK